MKRFAYSLILVLMASSSFANDTGEVLCGGKGFEYFPDELFGEEEIIPVDGAYFPDGFDSEDRIEGVITGWKPKPNYGEPRFYVDRVGNDVKITVKAAPRKTSIRLDVDMKVNFEKTVQLPKLAAGDYNIYVNPESIKPQFARMKVVPPTTDSIDDFLYPNVDHLTFDPEARTVQIVGENPSPCYKLEGYKYTTNGLNTYAIMPIMRVEEGVVCSQVITPFSYPYKLPSDLNADKILVHVRTIDGKSKNKVFSTANN